MNQTVRKMMRLIKSAISDTVIEETDFTLSEKELKNIYSLSNSHDLSQIVWRALQKNKIEVNEEISDVFKSKTYIAAGRYEQLNFEIENLKNIFEDAQIPYIFLKGDSIRKYYPEPWLRTSCDVDVLIKEDMSDKAVKILEKNGYKKEYFEYHNILMIAPSELHIELHFSIKENIKKSNVLLGKAWEYAEISENGKYRYDFNNEFFMFYFFAHTANHFLSGGCGIKPFIDLYLLEKSFPYDSKKLNVLLEEGGIKIFAEKMHELAYNWFDNGELSDLEEKMENYILTGGMYGTNANITMVKMKKNKNFLYFLRTVFLPYEALRPLFPIIDKYPILTPFCEVIRIVEIVFGGKLVKKVKNVKSISDKHDSKQADIEEMINQLKL